MIKKITKLIEALFENNSKSNYQTENLEINNSNKKTEPLNKENHLEWLRGLERIGHTSERLDLFEKHWPSMANTMNVDPQNLEKKRFFYITWIGGVIKSESEKQLETKYGDKLIAKRIINKELWIGMSKEMLLDVKGKPDHKTEKVTSNKKKEEFFYGKFQNLRGNDAFKFRVILVNDVVNSWNDI